MHQAIWELFKLKVTRRLTDQKPLSAATLMMTPWLSPR
jgi:hypothetical protein